MMKNDFRMAARIARELSDFDWLVLVNPVVLLNDQIVNYKSGNIQNGVWRPQLSSLGPRSHHFPLNSSNQLVFIPIPSLSYRQFSLSSSFYYVRSTCKSFGFLFFHELEQHTIDLSWFSWFSWFFYYFSMIFISFDDFWWFLMIFNDF